MPPSICVTLSTSPNARPSTLDVARLDARATRREPLDGALDRVHARPRPRRVGALAAERRARRSGCRGSRAGWCCRSARARSRGRPSSTAGHAAKSAGQRALLGRAAPRAGRRGAPRSTASAGALGGDPARELDHHGERRPSCRSRRARARSRPRSARAGCPAPEPCRGGRRAARAGRRPAARSRREALDPSRVHERKRAVGERRLDPGGGRGLVPALRRDVDERERGCGERVGAIRHGGSVSRRGRGIIRVG